MATQTVRIRGLKELQRDLKKMESEVAKDLKDELKEAAGIVSDEVNKLSARFTGVRPAKAVVTGRSAFARTTARSTHTRPDFARPLATTAYEPALEAKGDEVVSRLDKMLDHLGDKHGF